MTDEQQLVWLDLDDRSLAWMIAIALAGQPSDWLRGWCAGASGQLRPRPVYSAVPTTRTAHRE